MIALVMTLLAGLGGAATVGATGATGVPGLAAGPTVSSASGRGASTQLAQAAEPAQAPAGVSWPSGVFAGYGPTADALFGIWRDRSVATATDFIAEDTWSQIEDPQWTIVQWSLEQSITPDFSVPMWPATGGSLAAAAAGDYNAHFATLARNLVAARLGAIRIRLAWEFNGTWYPWSVASTQAAADYAAAWRQIVTAMRAVPGANFRFDWAPTQATGGIDPALAYPGDAYVSDIGLDVYDFSQQPGEAAAQRWSAVVGATYGLAWQLTFAAQHHKPIAFPEWGLVDSSTSPATSGGDDPEFVSNMHAWFAANHPAFENYFDVDSPTVGLLSGITTGSSLFPAATATYRTLFGG